MRRRAANTWAATQKDRDLERLDDLVPARASLESVVDVMGDGYSNWRSGWPLT
jgi:hypothetical protein